MSRDNKRTALAIVAVTMLALPAARASAATSTAMTVKGNEATASFSVNESIACGTTTATRTTFVSVQMFETRPVGKAAPAPATQTVVVVSRFETCTFTGSFDIGFFNTFTLQMTALSRATLAGHFVLEGGTVVDANLALTGVAPVQQGTFMQRSNLGKVMVSQHSVGSQSAATIAGTVSLDGHALPTSQMLSPEGFLANSTGGEVIVIRP